MFIVGVAVAFAIGKRKEAGVDKKQLAQKITVRSTIIFGIGLFLAAFPNFGIKEGSPIIHYILMTLLLIVIFIKEITQNEQRSRRMLWGAIWSIVILMALSGWGKYDFSRLRIPGVLQRIALVYLVCGLLFLWTNWRTLLYAGIGLLLSYWALMTMVPVPGGYTPNLDPETNLGAWLDRTLLGTQHLWSQSKTWDPEGLLSTLPAIVTGISGVLTGLWIRTNRSDYQKVAGMLSIGVILVVLGQIWDLAFPINKKIWTSSYVLYTSGVALLFLGVIYWLVDILNFKWWTKPFVVYGMNALFVYIMSGLVAKLLYTISWETQTGAHQTLGNWIYHQFFTPFLSDYNASLAYAIANVLFFLGLAWILYAKRIFIKV